jgi:hypothetical protein
MKKLLVAAVILAGVFVTAPAMDVSSHAWVHGTEFYFGFSTQECTDMARSWWQSERMAESVVGRLADGWDGAGGGLILGRVAAVAKVACDLQSMSKDYIKEWGEPGSWGYSVQRLDGWQTSLKILDAMAGSWRKAAIKF